MNLGPRKPSIFMRPVNQVREDVKRLHWALCLTGAKWTYSMQGYKREYTKLFGQNLLFSRALSLSLSPLLTNTWLTWASEEAPPANPRWVFLVLQAQKRTSLMMPRHLTKIASTIGAVCGNDVVAPTRTKIQNGDRWSETPFGKEERADGAYLGFPFDRSELKSVVSTPTCCDFAKIYPGMALWRRQRRRIELTLTESAGAGSQICGKCLCRHIR
jgi:hypothetical protein